MPVPIQNQSACEIEIGKNNSTNHCIRTNLCRCSRRWSYEANSAERPDFRPWTFWEVFQQQVTSAYSDWIHTVTVLLVAIAGAARTMTTMRTVDRRSVWSSSRTRPAGRCCWHPVRRKEAKTCGPVALHFIPWMHAVNGIRKALNGTYSERGGESCSPDSLTSSRAAPAPSTAPHCLP